VWNTQNRTLTSSAVTIQFSLQTPQRARGREWERERERERFLGWPLLLPALILAVALSSGTNGLWAAGSQSSVLPTLHTKLPPPGYDWNISVARRALAGKDASLDPRQARASPALWRIESGWRRGPQWIPKNIYSGRPWEPQVASVVGPPLFSLSFCSLLHLGLRICWCLRVLQRPLRKRKKDDKMGGRTSTE